MKTTLLKDAHHGSLQIGMKLLIVADPVKQQLQCWKGNDYNVERPVFQFAVDDSDLIWKQSEDHQWTFWNVCWLIKRTKLFNASFNYIIITVTYFHLALQCNLYLSNLLKPDISATLS